MWSTCLIGPVNWASPLGLAGFPSLTRTRTHAQLLFGPLSALPSPPRPATTPTVAARVWRRRPLALLCLLLLPQFLLGFGCQLFLHAPIQTLTLASPRLLMFPATAGSVSSTTPPLPPPTLALTGHSYFNFSSSSSHLPRHPWTLLVLVSVLTTSPLMPAGWRRSVHNPGIHWLAPGWCWCCGVVNAAVADGMVVMPPLQPRRHTSIATPCPASLTAQRGEFLWWPAIEPMTCGAGLVCVVLWLSIELCLWWSGWDLGCGAALVHASDEILCLAMQWCALCSVHV